jgi:3-oxoacyl-(acyl-carrier-protein) synthase
MALGDAGLAAADIDHVNAHGGGSHTGDRSEVRMLKMALGEEVAARVAVSATKSMHGHCMGATGALEASITALAVKEGLMPPTVNLHSVDADCTGVDHVANEARRADIRVALSANYGLGGHNAVLALTKHDPDGAG